MYRFVDPVEAHAPLNYIVSVSVSGTRESAPPRCESTVDETGAGRTSRTVIRIIIFRRTNRATPSGVFTNYSDRMRRRRPRCDHVIT